jgi:hypothetical protein
MAKSKTKSSILRFAQQDYSLHSSHPSFAQRTPRPLSRSSSLVLQDSPSRDSTPPRPKVAFADIAGASREVRVYPKGKKRDMQRKPPAANPPPSPTSNEWDEGSSGSTRPHRPSEELSSGSSPRGSFPGFGNPNLRLSADLLSVTGQGLPTVCPIGETTSIGVDTSSPLMKGKAPSGSTTQQVLYTLNLLY